MEEQNNTYADKVGLTPGSLVYIGKQNSQNVILSEINYSVDHHEENEFNEFSNCKSWDKSLTLSQIVFPTKQSPTVQQISLSSEILSAIFP